MYVQLFTCLYNYVATEQDNGSVVPVPSTGKVNVHVLTISTCTMIVVVFPVRLRIDRGENILRMTTPPTQCLNQSIDR